MILYSIYSRIKYSFLAPYFQLMIEYIFFDYIDGSRLSLACSLYILRKSSVKWWLVVLTWRGESRGEIGERVCGSFIKTNKDLSIY